MLNHFYLIQNGLSHLSLFTSSNTTVGFNFCNISLHVSPLISSLSNLSETIPCISSLVNSIWSLTSSYSITGFKFCGFFIAYSDSPGGLFLFLCTLFSALFATTPCACSVISSAESSAESCVSPEGLGNHSPFSPN